MGLYAPAYNRKHSEVNMGLYSHFIGIDIGKFSFVAHKHLSNEIKEYENTPSGIACFLKEYRTILPNSLCILETTGGYEMGLLLTLCHQKLSVHRANTRKVKHFIRSYGNDAKTDALDAKALALYGYERCDKLEVYEPVSEQAMALYELVNRRQDLKQMIVAEKNRLQAPRTKIVKKSCEMMIKTLSTELESITNEITLLIEKDVKLKKKKQVLKSVPGIGEIIANELIVLLPELGHLNRREIASLVGVAPKSNDSGKFSGYRSTGYGRSGIKPNLFLSAMAARNSNSPLKLFYEQLIARGKKKKVALTALMRKIIVIANARVRDLIAEEAKMALQESV